MAGRKVRDRDEAKACLAAVATLARWARANGIDGRSLNLWCVNLDRAVRRPQTTPPELRLVQLITEPAAPPSAYRIHAGPFVVEVGDGFDDDVLRRLLRVVVSC